MKRLTSLFLFSLFTLPLGCDPADAPDDGAAPADRGKADGPTQAHAR